MTEKKKLVYDIFCEKCDNILDITRSIPDGIEDFDTKTPTEISSDTEQDEVEYERILKKIEDGKKPTNEELNMINIKDMVKNEYYKKMAKKGEIKKNIIDMIDDMGNADDNTNAFMICKNCFFTKNIIPEFRVLSKNPEGHASIHDYTNEIMYRNKVHVRTMPSTRNYKCTNKDCPSVKGTIAPEAIFFRKNTNTHETIYVCKRCLTIKIN